MAEYRESNIRKLLYEYIKKYPGSSFKVLKNVFRMSEGNLRYHLHYLERRERIVIEKDGRNRCYYPTIRRRYSIPFGVELTPGQERILDLLIKESGITNRELMRRSGQDRPSFEYNIRKLRENRLIHRVNNRTGPIYEALIDTLRLEEAFLNTVKRFTEGNATKEELMDIVSIMEKMKRR